MAKQGKQGKTSTKPDQNLGTSSLKAIETKRRQVFKPILDNAFTQSNSWPFIEADLQNNILDLLEMALNSIGKYNKLAKDETDKSQLPPKPEILDNVTIGFNSTVKKLEDQAQSKGENTKMVKYVFVCKADITPTILTNFFPTLAFTASKPDDLIKLIQLPKGSIQRLSKATNIENTSILSLTKDVNDLGSLYNIIDTNVKDLELPWLTNLLKDQVFMKPSIKLVQTSAPLKQSKNDQKKEKKGKENKGDTKGEIKGENKGNIKGEVKRKDNQSTKGESSKGKDMTQAESSKGVENKSKREGEGIDGTNKKRKVI